MLANVAAPQLRPPGAGGGAGARSGAGAAGGSAGAGGGDVCAGTGPASSRIRGCKGRL